VAQTEKEASQAVDTTPIAPRTSENAKREKVKITVIDYDETHLEERQVLEVEECFPFKSKPTVTWINIDGVHDTEVIEKIGKHFDLHPLVLEAVVDTQQRPKREDFDHYIFISLKMLYYPPQSDEMVTEQVSIILGPNYVLSFQERPGDVFDDIRERIRLHKGRGRIRKMGSDYLAYALIDAIVDNYFVILERLGESQEPLEEKAVEDPKPEVIRSIQELKRKMVFLRSSVWPLREAINALQRTESPLIKKATMLYLRDVYDHTTQVIDAIEAMRYLIAGTLEVYVSSISNKLNEVVKVLTSVTIIVMLPTLVASVYGMNVPLPFQHSPHAFAITMLASFALAVLGVIILRKRRWL
jgi:magnesium transporter